MRLGIEGNCHDQSCALPMYRNVTGHSSATEKRSSATIQSPEAVEDTHPKVRPMQIKAKKEISASPCATSTAQASCLGEHADECPKSRTPIMLFEYMEPWLLLKIIFYLVEATPNWVCEPRTKL